ncbi:hypothetical protein BAE44_0007757 [Dichanthelium oligosanthes]|uniref:Uncharacterized protein n=1 Tax=Dichanthelium oligosanthes TaxID=888268 RepID=A0A1E5W1F4_9POAL|nr:hypothetical protein BAE44_0007757 [Dichanthelium oligosanthes]
METEAAMEGWAPRRQHRNGGFWLRAEIEMDRGSSIPRGQGFGFAAAVREPLVKLRRPQYDFERWDWEYFAWPHDHLDANLEMRDSDPEATLEADRQASESFLNQSTLQLERYEMYQHTQQQDTAAWPRNHLNTNLETRDSDPEATLEVDWKASESLLNQSMLHTQQQQHAAAWPCSHLKTNLEMRDSDLKATLEADRKASESFLNQSTLQPESYEMYQHTQEQHSSALPRDHLEANLEMRNTDAEAKLQINRKAKDRGMRQLKRSEMDRRMQEKHKEKENEEAELFRTPTPVNKKAVGPRSARRRCVFAEANRSLDDDRASQVSFVIFLAHLLAANMEYAINILGVNMLNI